MSSDAENPSQLKKFEDVPRENEKQSGGLSRTGLMVLIFLALQNCVKNIVMRAAVRGKATFLYSAAVIATEGLKCGVSALWVLLFVDGGSFASIFRYLRIEWRKTVLLMVRFFLRTASVQRTIFPTQVPAAIYNFQKTLEYVALRNLNAAVFSVLVQTKLFTTAICAVGLMGKSLRRAQVISLVLLTVGCVLAQLDSSSNCGETAKDEDAAGNKFVGVVATLCIAFSSGFASVYTEKVIKAVDVSPVAPVAPRDPSSSGGPNGANGEPPIDDDSNSKGPKENSLAYTQIQLAVASVLIEGLWAGSTDYAAIKARGLWFGFGWEAWLAVSMTALGGLAVAAVLRYADAILKGYATAISVILTGLTSHVLFGTVLNIEYALGICNVIAAMLLYNSTNLNVRAF